MKQYKLIQVALLAILLSGWAGCSQNEEEVPGDARNGIVLNVTDTGLIGNEPSTRTEETGFVTTFTQGDQIGLFAVKDGAISDEINNMPFTFNGSSWSGKPILYDERLAGVTFYAYYPYQPDMSGKTDLAGDDFFAPLVAGWELTTEQSDPKAYAKQDLMTSNATALIGENGNYSLSFQLTHRMSLVVVKLPSTRYVFTDAEGTAVPEQTPYVAMPVDVAFYLDKVDEGNKIFPYYDARQDEYRLLRKPSSENRIIGHYNDKQCTLDTAEKMKAGRYKRFVVDGGYKEKTHHLQVGDYYYADGSLLSKEAEEADIEPERCIGVVCWVGNPQPSVLYATEKDGYTSAQDVLSREHPDCVNGLVVSLHTVNDKFVNSTGAEMRIWYRKNFADAAHFIDLSGNFYDGSKTTSATVAERDRILGYNNTRVMEAYKEANSAEIQALQVLDTYQKTAIAPAISTDWFLPSVQELRNMQDKNGLLTTLNNQIAKVQGTSIDTGTQYWSSTERNASNMYYVSYTATSSSVNTGGKKTDARAYRFVLAF